ncbi:MAG: S53 family peptidase, partial [Acidimicrobiales bacterium]
IQGLAVTSVSPDRDLVALSGSSTAVAQAFGVAFHRYGLPGGATFRSATSAATVPAALAGDVRAVVGLTTLGRASLAPVATPSVSFPTSYDPQQLWSHYDAPATRTGAGQAVAVLAAGTLARPQADLATFEHDFGLPAVPWTTVPVGPRSSTTAGDDEWDLDTQYATGMAGDVGSLMVYDTTSLTDATVLAETDRWVTDDAAPQADFSAGECEVLADQAGFLPAEDEVLEQAVAQGQTLFAASGDTGSTCPALVGVNGVPAGLPDVNYPASSPYAVSVGGTTILGGPGPLAEIGWYAGGGGLSLVEPEPADQAGVGGSDLGLRRGVPDVAFDADPDSGFDVIVGGQEEVVGGTSGSSPSWVGIWARAQAAHGGGLGFAGDVVYREPSSSFRDVTVGTDGAYPCTPGYDYVTGRGVPDVSAFVSAA